MSTRSPAGNVFRHAVAGGIAMHAVSAGFVRRALRSFALPQPWMLPSSSSEQRSEIRKSSFVSHCIFFGFSLVQFHL